MTIEEDLELKKLDLELEKIDAELAKYKKNKKELKVPKFKKSNAELPSANKTKKVVKGKGGLPLTTLSLKGSNIDILKDTQKILGIIPNPFKKKAQTVIFYFTRSRTLKVIALSQDLKTILTLFKREEYITYNPSEYDVFFYRNKSILWIHPDSVLNLQLDINKQKLFCDSDTFHQLVNNVIEYRLTHARGSGEGLIGFVQKYWFYLLIAGVFAYLSQQEGGLGVALGFS